MFSNRYVRLAVGVVAALVVLQVLGVSASSIVLLAVVLACPLMMFFMMRGMGGMGHDSDRDARSNHDVGTSGRR